MRRFGLGLVLLIVACATVAAFPSTRMAPKASMTLLAGCTEPTDTSRIRLSWTPVLDRRGAVVDEYRYLLHRMPNDTVDDGSTQGTEVVISMVCPQYGDSVTLFAEVQAIDVRGTPGDIGRSNNLIIRTFDPGPPAPVITIDTIPETAQLDSLTFDSDHYYVNDGDNLWLGCEVKLWQGEEWTRPDECDTEEEFNELYQRAGLALLVYGGPSR